MESLVEIRPGRGGDGSAVLTIWDAAIAWMVERGQAKQWGTELASELPRCREMVREWETGPGLRIAELDGQVVGASVVISQPPEHVSPAIRRETYLLLLAATETIQGRA